MARLEDAVREAEDGVALDLEVQPGARADTFPAGFNPWRSRITAKVQAPPVEGEANGALCSLVSTFFEVPSGRVTIAQGESSRQKTIVVQGLAWDQALQRLREGLKAQA